MGNVERVAELIASLEQATIMAKQIGATVDQAQLFQIYSSLHHTHHYLSAFLSSIPAVPTATDAGTASAENSLSSTTGFAEPMQLGEEENAGDVVVEAAEEEENSAVVKVEERMRECFIKNKRPKRPLSPSAAAVATSTAAEERRVREDGFAFDAHEAKLRALDLVYQFHG